MLARIARELGNSFDPRVHEALDVACRSSDLQR
jgi:hypothetical protein